MGRTQTFTPVDDDDRWNVDSWLEKEQGGNTDSCPVLSGTVPTEGAVSHTNMVGQFPTSCCATCRLLYIVPQTELLWTLPILAL